MKSDALKDLRTLATLITQTREALKKLETRERNLTKAGVLNAYVHYRKDRSGAMFYNLPVDSTGKRKKVYVGTDPKKKQAILDKKARWEQREALQSAIAEINHRLFELSAEIAHIRGLAKSAQNMAKTCVAKEVGA